MCAVDCMWCDENSCWSVPLVVAYGLETAVPNHFDPPHTLAQCYYSIPFASNEIAQLIRCDDKYLLVNTRRYYTSTYNVYRYLSPDSNPIFFLPPDIVFVLFRLFMFVSHNGEAYFEIGLVVLFFFLPSLLLLVLLLVWFSRISIPRVFNAFGYGCYVHISILRCTVLRLISALDTKIGVFFCENENAGERRNARQRKMEREREKGTKNRLLLTENV